MQAMSPPGLFRTSDGKSFRAAFFLVSSLFLLWGFCNGMIDVMDKHFQNTLHINKAESTWVQFANYMGYFLMAIPAGKLADKFGYRKGIIIGLVLIGAGALWFVPAIRIDRFWAFLTGLFVLATGLTCLETIANPYTTILGPPETGAARINWAQSANGVGWILGPVVGGHFIFSATGAGSASGGNANLFIPYLGVAVVVGLLAAIFALVKLPEANFERTRHETGARSVWRRPHFVGAVVAQFFYVAAQTGIFSFFINYLDSESPDLAAGAAARFPSGWIYAHGGGFRISELGASRLLSLGGFTLFLLGRVLGSALLRRHRAHAVLAAFALANLGCMALILMHQGWLSTAALLGSFFAMSIMFPTIFALGIAGLGDEAKRGSSYIVMAIVGGAIMPMLMGWIGDHHGMTAGFLMPLGCFVIIGIYGLAWPRLSGLRN